MQLKVIRSGLEAGAEDANGVIDFVHLQVGGGEILVRGGIVGIMGERALKKRNGSLGVPRQQKS